MKYGFSKHISSFELRKLSYRAQVLLIIPFGENPNRSKWISSHLLFSWKKLPTAYFFSHKLMSKVELFSRKCVHKGYPYKHFLLPFSLVKSLFNSLKILIFNSTWNLKSRWFWVILSPYFIFSSIFNISLFPVYFACILLFSLKSFCSILLILYFIFVLLFCKIDIFLNFAEEGPPVGGPFFHPRYAAFWQPISLISPKTSANLLQMSWRSQLIFSSKLADRIAYSAEPNCNSISIIRGQSFALPHELLKLIHRERSSLMD